MASRVSDIASPFSSGISPARPPSRTEKHDPAKGNFTEEDSDATLEKTFQLARFFGTKKVRIFSLLARRRIPRKSIHKCATAWAKPRAWRRRTTWC